MIRPAWRSGGILIRLRHVGVGVHAGVHCPCLYRDCNCLAGPVSIIVFYSVIRVIENLSLSPSCTDPCPYPAGISGFAQELYSVFSKYTDEVA